MAGRITLWGADQLLTSYFSKKAEVPPSFHLALIKDVAPTPFISGAELDEPIGGSYVRTLIPNDTDHFSNIGQPQVINLEANVQFLPATDLWGMIRYWALCNSEVDGFVYFIGKLVAPMRVDNGDIAFVPAGDLSVALGPFFTAEDL